MAEAADLWTSKILCRYFMHGICREGERCRYSHDPNSKPQAACKFYLKGQCSYGDKCRYDHVKPSGGQQPDNRHPATPINSKVEGIIESSGPKPVHAVLLSKDTPLTSHMVTLKKKNQKDDTNTSQDLSGSIPDSVRNPDEWVKAAEFVPGQKWQGLGPTSYLDAAQIGLDVAQTGLENLHINEESGEIVEGLGEKKELCPFAAHGECRYGENCAYIHGEFCELCGRAILHPYDEEERNRHTEQCMKEHEEDMELSFAIQRSSDKVCGICMDIIMEKKPVNERRFGILSNCNHVFCLSCIRKWRAAKQFENKIIRACPECRVKSDFVTPSKYWVEEKEEKEKLITGYKGALGQKACKYFDQGRGECPFNENCFYLHAYPDGRKASPRPIRRRRRQNAEGDLDIFQQLILWDFLEEHRRRLAFEIDWVDELDELLFHAGLWDSSSDDSDYSDFDGFL